MDSFRQLFCSLALVALYEETEKPENALDYMKQFLGPSGDLDFDALKNENEELKRKVIELNEKIQSMDKGKKVLRERGV